MDIKIIRAAILKNRGGHENTSDSGILTLWNSLDAETREKYLKTVEPSAPSRKEKTNGYLFYFLKKTMERKIQCH
jgi:hypothetical protein